MPFVCVRERVRVMSRKRAHADAVAVTASGDLLVNAIWFNGVATLEQALLRAKREKGAVFVGFVVEDDEVHLVTERVSTACREGAAFVVGSRQRQARRR
jgi:hypothetical protein